MYWSSSETKICSNFACNLLRDLLKMPFNIFLEIRNIIFTAISHFARCAAFLHLHLKKMSPHVNMFLRYVTNNINPFFNNYLSNIQDFFH
mmetsp:Transcript_35685/g.42995  ORF Transcript_35685/g.42995 Transcript_35685/m.42995 type:complete len:90 (-) Transcript_35685:1303-1572(-)